ENPADRFFVCPNNGLMFVWRYFPTNPHHVAPLTPTIIASIVFCLISPLSPQIYKAHAVWMHLQGSLF
ncbi:MAG: hypothetical protein ACJ788_17525, partial [Ktedonobacteraceae bacterium]